jgi:hypothetical protein
MKVAITDANIFIDLIKLQILGYLFNIDIDIYTTREVVDQLNSSQYEKVDSFIQAELLKVYNFSSEELTEIIAMPAPRSLEFPDKTVVYLAVKISAEVLTGDGPLRKFCAGNQLIVRGIIWLFDTFLEKELITHIVAIEKMNHLLSFNDRLPKADCLNRIKQWEGKINQ